MDKRCVAPNILGEESEFLGEESLEYFCSVEGSVCNELDIAALGLKDYPICKKVGNPLQGTFSFDNILYSILNIFQIITLEGWTNMMYIVRKATGSTAYDFMFVLIVLFGAFFVLNLMIAVQFTYLGEAFDEEDRRQKEIKEKINLKKKIKMEQEEEDSFFDDEE